MVLTFETLVENEHGAIKKVVHDDQTFWCAEPKRESVLVAPFTTEGRIVLIHHYRPVVNQTIWELPGGAIEPGETGVGAARRELLEETGYEARSLETVFYGYDRPGILKNKLLLYLARDCVRITSPQPDPYILEVQDFTLEQASLAEPQLVWVTFLLNMLKYQDRFKK